MKKIFILFLIISIFHSKSYALIEIDITRGNLDPLPIAVSPLHVDIKSDKSENLNIKELGDNISKIIENNFRSTGLFNPLKKRSFCSKTRYRTFKTSFRGLEID